MCFEEAFVLWQIDSLHRKLCRNEIYVGEECGSIVLNLSIYHKHVETRLEKFLLSLLPNESIFGLVIAVEHCKQIEKRAS